MAPLDILASVHESLVHLLVALLRREPEALLAIFARARGELPGRVTHERLPSFELPGLRRRAHRRAADLLISVEGRGGETALVLAIEVQVCVDAEKRWRWSELAVAAAAEFRAEAQVVVFALSPALRQWIRGLAAGMSVAPVLVEREHVPLLTSLGDARGRPLATLLGALMHARGVARAVQVAGARAALVALSCLDERMGERYGVLMADMFSADVLEQAKRSLHQSSSLGTREARALERIDDFVRESYSFVFGHREGQKEGLEAGRQAGHQAGRAWATRRALFDLLALQGVTLDEPRRAAIAAVEDPETLEAWYALARASKCDRLAEIFDELVIPIDPAPC
ncbi:hypothetical protein G6O69_32120 [Pseudenhygromyxa sp. WMMC2535]|uniref:hypothetical protein n=1 Tax=Pseudenhygromyxa sp. WMMC2535 TaxID=2712867 RepID=UPI001556E724|nr:hypothetical protein [Pseudenhygromyxa sp. WMMC2535]NVB42514.1 hypothetical protein [Pseudenhygromyxa sp. WMMC2535]